MIHRAGRTGTCGYPIGGLVSWWPLDGDARDAAGENEGTLMGNPSFARGHAAEAITLNGTDQYIEIPDDPDLDLTDSITIDAWVKWDGGRIVVAQKRAIPGGGYALQVTGDGRPVATVYGRFDHYAVQSLPAGEWSHLAWTYDRSESRLFVNGSLFHTLNHTGSILANDRPLQIGRVLNTTGTTYGVGTTDELALYDRALSEWEIEALYELGRFARVSPQDYAN